MRAVIPSTITGSSCRLAALSWESAQMVTVSTPASSHHRTTSTVRSAPR